MVCDIEEAHSTSAMPRKDKNLGDISAKCWHRPGYFYVMGECIRMAWVNLVIAGIFEVIWAINLKYSQSFSRLLPSIITIAGMIVSFFFLSLATKSLPIGTAYAVWTGIGAVGTILLGILLFHEPISLLRAIFLIMIIGGIIGLKVTAA
jgi:quaternary ammonium compound-resistance protein SugE